MFHADVFKAGSRSFSRRTLRSQTLILFVHVLRAQLQVRLGSSTLANHTPKHVYPETGPRNIPRQYSLLRMCFLYISLATIFSAYSHAFCPLLNFTLGATSAVMYSDHPKPAILKKPMNSANLLILMTPQIHSSQWSMFQENSTICPLLKQDLW